MKVVVGGPPQSGKSTFTASLLQIIRERKRGRSYNISFTWVPLDVTDNSIATLLNPTEDIEQKRDVDWDPERAEERRAVFEARDERLVIADAPGQVTDQLRTVAEPADAIIILTSREKEEQLDEWREFATEEDLDVFAELTTVLEEDVEVGWINRNERIGVLCSVEREEFEEKQIDSFDDTTHRMLKQLGADLLKEA